MPLFTLKMRNCVKLADEDRRYFINEMKRFVETEIQAQNLEEITFYWCNDMNDKNGILGAFSQWHPNKIFLKPSYHVKDMLRSTVAHELVHRYQFMEFGAFFYTLFAIPILREFMLEKLANTIEKKADRFFR